MIEAERSDFKLSVVMVAEAYEALRAEVPRAVPLIASLEGGMSLLQLIQADMLPRPAARWVDSTSIESWHDSW